MVGGRPGLLGERDAVAACRASPPSCLAGKPVLAWRWPPFPRLLPRMTNQPMAPALAAPAGGQTWSCIPTASLLLAPSCWLCRHGRGVHGRGAGAGAAPRRHQHVHGPAAAAVFNRCRGEWGGVCGVGCRCGWVGGWVCVVVVVGGGLHSPAVHVLWCTWSAWPASCSRVWPCETGLGQHLTYLCRRYDRITPAPSCPRCAALRPCRWSEERSTTAA